MDAHKDNNDKLRSIRQSFNSQSVRKCYALFQEGEMET